MDSVFGNAEHVHDAVVTELGGECRPGEFGNHEGNRIFQAHYLDFPVVDKEALRRAGHCAKARSHMVAVQHASAGFPGDKSIE